MYSQTLSWFKRSTRTSGSARESAPRPIFRPQLDALEDRTVMSITPLVNLPLDVGPVTAVTTTIAGQPAQRLQAPVFIAGQQAGTLLMDATTEAPVGAALLAPVPILELELQPISLNLLGLHVDTSAICLDVTADPDGGLLGQLLAGLGGGLDLGGILGQLDDAAADLNTFLDEVGSLLDGVLGRAMRVTEVFGTPVTNIVTTNQADEGFCDILNLSLGPINLNLLGLGVSLDNCENGPVTVDVTADPNGGLLGGLLCGLADGFGGNIINRLVGRIDRIIDRLGALADRLGDIAALPDRIERLADRLIDQLERFADRADSLADLDRLVNNINRTIRRLDRIIDNLDAPARVINRLEGLVMQLTRIVNRFRDLGLVDRTSLPVERIIDRLMAQL
jgi:hypothetical protein